MRGDSVKNWPSPPLPPLPFFSFFCVSWRWRETFLVFPKRLPKVLECSSVLFTFSFFLLFVCSLTSVNHRRASVVIDRSIWKWYVRQKSFFFVSCCKKIIWQSGERVRSTKEEEEEGEKGEEVINGARRIHYVTPSSTSTNHLT